MHELAIAVEVLEAAEEAARPHSGRVLAVHVRVGPLSGVVPEALRSAFEMARVGSSLDAADLVVEETPLVARCHGCDAERTLANPAWMRCPTCGSADLAIVAGRELEIAALEIDT